MWLWLNCYFWFLTCQNNSLEALRPGGKDIRSSNSVPLEAMVAHLIERVNEFSEKGIIRCQAEKKAGGEEKLEAALRANEVKTGKTKGGITLYFFQLIPSVTEMW